MIFAIYVSNKGLIWEINKELPQIKLKRKRQSAQQKNGQKNLKSSSLKK